LLEQRYGLQLQRAQQTMECVAANEYEQALFGIRAGAAMLLLEGVTYGERDLPVEYFKAIYRGDRCKFHLESWRNRSDVETAGAQRVSVIVA
ncbi:MAG: UTRA domain-containing protein, partial [Caldilinea sp.]|nr:UTRA domain-containing protein [Caldilinea sp.]